ncbi:MAG: Ig-like domain-containing protein, partial [Gammaproteobacteria bacterium]|nr:Ig-like domain-containing protein [Gammaproteobacteria bacterium]
DQINEGDVLTTGISTQIVLEFYDGQKLQLGENTEILLDESVFASLNAYPDDRADQLAELQSLIVEGIDLAELEATAAGASGDSANALHQASVYSREGSEGIVETRVTPFNNGGSSFNEQNPLGDDPVLVAADTTEDSPAATPTTTPPVSPPPAASISVDSITADDVINAVEAGGLINVSGSVGGDASPGDAISFTINGTSYNGSVGAGSTFSISVAGADLAADNSFTASVAGTDAAGTAYSATTTSTHGVDTSASATISVDPITADDVVNAAESAASINVTGSVGGDVSPGDTVGFIINGTAYSGTVGAGNTFSISVPGADLAADTSFDATVTGTDTVGNPFSATTTSSHTVDTTTNATISVDPITADDVVNAAESAASINVTGSVGGDASPGDTVGFTINGTAYSGTVGAGNTFSISVAGADLAADTNFDASVSGNDSAGNPFT